MAAPNTARAKRKAEGSATRKTVAEHMREQIPGDGVFLVAAIRDYPNRSYPPPSTDMADLWLTPGRPVTIDTGWLASPLLIRDWQAEIVTLEFLDQLPRVVQLDPDPATLDGLPQTMKLMVRTIGDSEFIQQYKDLLLLARHIAETGMPIKNSRITKSYLQGEYAVFLRAVLAFEKIRRARPEVISLVTAQLERIEAM